MGFDIIKSGKSVLKGVTGGIPKVNGDSLMGSLGNVASGIIRPTGEPQRAYMWEVSIMDSSASMIRYYAQTTSLPVFSTTNLRRNYMGVRYSYPGQVTSPGTVRVTFWDSQDLVAYRYFLNWFQDINDAVANRRVNPEHYKRGIKIALKDTSDVLVDQEFTLNNSFPIEVTGTQLSYESSELFTFDVEFSYDRAVMGNTGLFESVGDFFS